VTKTTQEYSCTWILGPRLSEQLIKFDKLELDLGCYQLRRNGDVPKLEKTPMELLILLVAKNGQLVSREEIIEKLWGRDVFVDSEHGVNTAIRKIRQVLNDDREQPRFIETIVGKGYRFVAAIKVVPARTASEFVSRIPAPFGSDNGNSSGMQPPQPAPAELLEGEVPRQQTRNNSQALQVRPGAVEHVALLTRKPLKVVALCLGLVFVTFIVLGVLAARHSARVHWSREQAVPEIAELAAKGEYQRAFKLAEEAEKHIARDPRLLRLWPSFSGPVTVNSSPEGAEIYIKPYKPTSGMWEYLGRTPIEKRRLPFGFFRWKAEKPGFAPVERALFAASENDLREMTFQMFENDSAILGMVYVKGGSFSLQIPGFEGHQEVDLGNYWIDKFEVTNREFKAFVQAGGYTNPKFWKQKFLRNGRELSWKQAIAAFRDKTGRPGPSTWEIGDYPTNQADYPVTG